MQLGCGVGNTSLPVAKANTMFRHIYSCDYAATAVHLLQSSSEFQPDRMTAFVADVTRDDLAKHVPLASVDVATCIFVLSANAPESLPNVRFLRQWFMCSPLNSCDACSALTCSCGVLE